MVKIETVFVAGKKIQIRITMMKRMAINILKIKRLKIVIKVGTVNKMQTTQASLPVTRPIIINNNTELTIAPSTTPTTTTTPTTPTTNRVFTRASVEYNGMELVLPILILYKEEIDNYQKLTDKLKDIGINPGNYPNIIFNDFNTDFKKYENDVYKKVRIVSDYIKYFRDISSNEILEKDNIRCIYVCGKTNKHVKINELNKDLDKKDAKADIYIECLDGVMVGISIKQSIDATKSNYSVHRLFDKETEASLTELKKNYLKKNGFTAFKKSERVEINKLFYSQNKENEYWIGIREAIKNNNLLITEKLIRLLYSLNVNYAMYEFDGKNFYKLNENVDLSDVKFAECADYYLTKAGKERETAKLFYKLLVGKKKYRVEIRWKGNVYNASPQFQIHDDE